MMIFNSAAPAPIPTPTRMSAPMTAEKLQGLVRSSMENLKCRKCGCMKETLLTLQGQLICVTGGQQTQTAQGAEALLGEVNAALGLMAPIEYT